MHNGMNDDCFEENFGQFSVFVSLSRGHNDKIFCLRWNPHDDDRFVTVGVKHIKFWTRAGGGMTSKQGVFGKAAGKQGKESQMCVVFGKTADACITGGGDGCIYIWNATALMRKVSDAHKGPLFAMTAVQDKVGFFFLEFLLNTKGGVRLLVGFCDWWKRWKSYSLGYGF